MYNPEQISNIFTKLLTEFEEVEYYYSSTGSVFNDIFETNAKDYTLKPKIKNNIFPVYKIETMKEYNSKRLAFLPPSSYISKYKTAFNYDRIKDTYIEKFIDFLYIKRVENLLSDISYEELENILKEFLTLSKDLKDQRREERNKEIKQEIEYRKRKEFEDSCLIDRKTIYNALSYIINNYENNMIANQVYEEKNRTTNDSYIIESYHKLIVKSEKWQIQFYAYTNSLEVMLDEYYHGSLNKKKDYKIQFFRLKNKLSLALKESLYLNEFMKMIEEKYNEKRDITIDDIQESLAKVANSKKRILKK